jgi:hypothetical protein
MSDRDREFFDSDTPGNLRVSPRISDWQGRALRIASAVIDGEGGVALAKQKGEVVLRETPAGRYQIKATFYEDDRVARSLTIQKFTRTGPSDRYYFSLVGGEIDTLLAFASRIRELPIERPGGQIVRGFDREGPGERLGLGDEHARALFQENQDLFLKLAEQEYLARDLVALGYRRQQLERFDRLLHDAPFFEGEAALANGPEAVWQAFFESNRWIFGYGLSYISFGGLDDRKLEQIVSGYDIAGAGKRADALMKTRAEINSLCFVEIKRHDANLLADKPYRSDTWVPSHDLAGGVAQSQVTVQAAVERIGRKVNPTDKVGDPTGETLYTLNPRAFLVVGNLTQFQTETGINESKLNSFELYRRNVYTPEIITFDELFYRARFIVEHD